MRKIKNIIIYAFSFIIIVLSLKLPEILLKIHNNSIEKEVYEKKQIETLIDVEAEKIYLVKAIHDIENQNYTVAISSNKNRIVENSNEFEKTYKELLKLKEYEILKDVELSEKNEISLIEQEYGKNNKYIINNIQLELNNKYELEIENKTGKILSIAIEKENLANDTNEEIMRNFVKYLDLYIIDDWKLENNMLKSQKAGLTVTIAINYKNDYCILSIHKSY